MANVFLLTLCLLCRGIGSTDAPLRFSPQEIALRERLPRGLLVDDRYLDIFSRIDPGETKEGPSTGDMCSGRDKCAVVLRPRYRNAAVFPNYNSFIVSDVEKKELLFWRADSDEPVRLPQDHDEIFTLLIPQGALYFYVGIGTVYEASPRLYRLPSRLVDKFEAVTISTQYPHSVIGSPDLSASWGSVKLVESHSGTATYVDSRGTQIYQCRMIITDPEEWMNRSVSAEDGRNQSGLSKLENYVKSLELVELLSYMTRRDLEAIEEEMSISDTSTKSDEIQMLDSTAPFAAAIRSEGHYMFVNCRRNSAARQQIIQKINPVRTREIMKMTGGTLLMTCILLTIQSLLSRVEFFNP